MLFNSLEFLAFFPLVVALVFALPAGARWGVLLVASYVFYASWEPAYLLIILASTLVDYGVGLAMGRRATRRERRPLLLVSLVANLGDHFRSAAFVGQIPGHQARAGNAFGHVAALPRFELVNDNRRTFLGQAGCDNGARAAMTTGDQRGATV